MKCDECPAAWYGRDIMTACGVEHGEYGCLIRGMEYGAEGEYCNRPPTKVRKQLEELKDYARGRIRRPEWVLQRFLHDLESQMSIAQCGLPGFPPLWQKKREEIPFDDEYCITVKPLYGSTDWHYQRESDKRQANERLESIKKQIADFKCCAKSESSDYLTGYLSALSAVEGMIAEVEE
jgi:hypothetical protein